MWIEPFDSKQRAAECPILLTRGIGVAKEAFCLPDGHFANRWGFRLCATPGQCRDFLVVSQGRLGFGVLRKAFIFAFLLSLMLPPRTIPPGVSLAVPRS